MLIENNVLLSVRDSDILDGTIVIPDNITSIKDHAFYGCSELTSITIPNSVKSIGMYAFAWCTSLTGVYINSIESWCNIDFSDSYSNPLCYAHNLYLNNVLVTNLVISDSVTSIGEYAFSNCTSLSSITIPDSVTTIGGCTFGGCTSLSSVAFENSSLLTSIGGRAFYKCTSLSYISIPNGVTSIGYSAFENCTSLFGIYIPNSVTSIGSNAFSHCTSLESVTFGENSKLKTIGNMAFYECKLLKEITIPNSVTSIGSDVFGGCESLIKKDKKYYYKAFESDLTCRCFQYKENKWFTCNGKIKLCEKGFHACKNAFDLFNYYKGKINGDIVIYKVELQNISKERQEDSKVVAKKIRLVEKINSYAELLN